MALLFSPCLAPSCPNGCNRYNNLCEYLPPLYRESTLCRYLNSINAFLSHICIGLALQHERLQFLSETWPFMGSAAACIGGVHLLAASHNIRCFGVTFFFYKE